MKIKKNDMVKIIAGDHKGKTGKVLQVMPTKQMVVIEGIGQFTRHLKPSQLKPQGGTKEIHRPLHASKVALITDKDKTARIGYEVKKDGTKTRVARNLGNKEIK
ncbi:MAG TPA: 50S ribosomal protein L24 [Candidatus Acidoferrum sp.]|nr:50S ribosomal protein L24 [Candidatus Acidoferrum sp.]